MKVNDFYNQWLYFEPEWYSSDDTYAKSLIKIFYIARILFSEVSNHPVKRRLVPLLNREGRSSQKELKDNQKSIYQSTVISDHFKLGKITSIDQISSILPREFLTYSELIFYKKLINQELYRMEFEDPEDKIISVDDLVKGKDKVNKAQKLYILFDNSTSMEGEKMQKFFVAKAIILEYLRKISPEKPRVYFRFFNSEPGDLIKANNRFEYKDLIRNIVTLQTGGINITNIGKAILQAIDDIKSDLSLIRSEILIITDGLGPFPDNLKELLGFIRLNVILVPSLNLEKVMSLYPDKESWEQIDDKERKMPDCWHYHQQQSDIQYSLTQNKEGALKDKNYNQLLLELDQVYQMQDIADLFITIMFTEVVKNLTFNPRELRFISSLRLDMEESIKKEISGHNKLILYKRIEFIINYLRNILRQRLQSGLVLEIKVELKEYKRLRNIILRDRKIRDQLGTKIESIDYKFQFYKEPGQKIIISIHRVIKALWQRIVNIFYGVMKKIRLFFQSRDK